MNPDEFFQKNLVPAGFAIDGARTRLRRFQSGETGLSTGWANLDRFMRLTPGELTTIGGRAGTGKTAFGMQLVYNTLNATRDRIGGHVVVFSAEMDGASLMLREACAQEGVSFWGIQSRTVSEDVYDRVDQALSRLEGKRLLIDESPAPTLEHMLDQLSTLEGRTLRLILFDYTELSGEMDRVESQRIAKISRGLKAIAKKFSAPVVNLSQLNRDIEGREDKTPSMRDLMYGGEREPDRIILLVRPWLYDKSKTKELVTAHVVKNRNGPTGEALFSFDESVMRFRSAVLERQVLPQIMQRRKDEAEDVPVSPMSGGKIRKQVDDSARPSLFPAQGKD